MFSLVWHGENISSIILSWYKHKVNDRATVKTKVYRQNSDMSHTLVSNKVADHSDVVGVGTAATTYSFSS